MTNMGMASVRKVHPLFGMLGVSLSFDYSWRITVGHRMHNSCCACVYQLLCKRTTAVVRPTILTVSTTYPISSDNFSYLFQQHILSLSTTSAISSSNFSYLFQQLQLSCFNNISVLFQQQKRVHH